MNHSIRTRFGLMDFARPRIMGVLNFTEDSFYAGSRLSDIESLVAKAKIMLDEGADILDIGASSTRPGAEPLSEPVERERLTSAIKAVTDAFPKAVISADTYRSVVALAAVEAGAQIVNDVSGGTLDEEMFDAVAELGVPYVLMHMRGTPQTMNSKAHYDDVVNTVVYELSHKLETLRRRGVADVVIDPGFGFAKTASHNFEMLRRLEEFKLFDTPLMVGLSRKSMVWRTLEIDPEESLNGTTALNMVALQNGANILRVHDVMEARQTIRLFEALRKSVASNPSQNT